MHGDEQKELKEALMYSTTPLMFYDENEVRYERLKRKVKIPMFGSRLLRVRFISVWFLRHRLRSGFKTVRLHGVSANSVRRGGQMTDWEGEPLKFVVEEEGGDGESFQGEVLAAASERLWRRAWRV